MSARLFGTDGIRGRAGAWPLVDEFLTGLGRVVGERVMAQDGAARVVIGHDGRASGPGIVAALTAGLRGSGAAVHEIGLCTTPALAYLAAAGPFQAGIMVSASHNPAEDNGVKLFGHDGLKFPDAAEAELEAALQQPLPAARAPGAQTRDAAVLDQYVGWLRDSFADLDLRGRRILVDCAHGGASQLAARVLAACGATPVPLNDQPDGTNINRDCGALHPEAAARETAARGCDLGISLDGDADRGIVVDGAGRVLDGDALLAGLGRHHQSRGELANRTVVATVMSNLALETWLAASGVRLLRTQVGDRFVAEAMRAGGHNLGGEKSGHILFGNDHGWRGDGLYTLLRVLRVLSREKIDATGFARGYVDFPQRLLNLKVTKRVPLEQLPALAAEDRLLQGELQGSGRSVIRFSGTELRLRLMVEARDAALVDSALQRLAAAARRDGILAE